MKEVRRFYPFDAILTSQKVVDASDYDALLAERNELLAALELCLNAVGLAGWSDDHCAVTARAAIAKSRGDV
jgi:hypothetical protein